MRRWWLVKNPSNLEPLSAIEVTPQTLHVHWPFVRRGLDSICHRIHPDWVPEDIYSALRMASVNCAIIQRAGKSLCFGVYYRENRVFSGKHHLFLWAGWALPESERTEADNVPEAFAYGWRYLRLTAKTVFGTDYIWWITSPGRAKAFERKYGWKPKFVTIEVKV